VETVTYVLPEAPAESFQQKTTGSLGVASGNDEFGRISTMSSTH